MSDQSPKRPPGNPNWQKGTSGNPRGRPRSGLAFAERVRERVDPDYVIDTALEAAADPDKSASERLDALLKLIDRGFIKPPTTIAARIETSSAPRAYDHLSDAELELELARVRAQLAPIDSMPRLEEPMAPVEESLIAHPVTTEAKR